MGKTKKDEIWKELSNMKPVKVKLEQLYLDPNNPRLEASNNKKITDKRAVEEGIQTRCLERIRTEIKVGDLIDSIKTCGFATIDRIVLRLINQKQYIVVEGNRRVTALKILVKKHKEGSMSLNSSILKGIEQFEALLYKGDNKDIAWVIQGLRHATGIKKWEDYPKAKWITRIHEAGTSPGEIASRFGMKPQAEVSRLIRAYYGFEQAKTDVDYGDDLKQEKFGMFTEVVFAKSQIKDWLGWDDPKKRFKKTDNLNKFVAWTVPDEEGKTKIDISATTRDTLSKLVLPENKKLFEDFEEGKVGIDECRERISTEEMEITVDLSANIKSLEKMKGMLIKLPIAKMQLAKDKAGKEQKKRIIELLKELNKVVKRQLENLKG